MSRAFLDALGATHSIVCLTGAGGKKTTMLRLARCHPGKVALATTTKIPDTFGKGDPALIVCPDPADPTTLPPGIDAGQRLFSYAGPLSRSQRCLGCEPEFVRYVHEQTRRDLSLVKAHGARMRRVTAQAPDPGRLVGGAVTILHLASVKVVSSPLMAETVHHHLDFGALAGMREKEPIMARHLARVLMHQTDTIAAATDADIIVVLNMADSPDELETARDIAEQIIANGSSVHRVVATSMFAEQPVRAVFPLQS